MADNHDVPLKRDSLEPRPPDEVRAAFADLLARELGEKRAGGVRMSAAHNPLPSEMRWAMRFLEDFESALMNARSDSDVSGRTSDQTLTSLGQGSMLTVSADPLCDGTEHIIQFKEDGWTIAHPLMERLDGSLFDCEMKWDADDPGVRGKFFLLAPNCIGGEA